MSVANPVLVEATRNNRVESWHRGAIAVVDANGKVQSSIGDTARPIYPRSAVKALQALMLVESGAADRYGFGNAELALACASHNGEPRHVETVAKMLAAAGRSEADLECGTHPLGRREVAEALVRAGKVPTPLHHNCSGKHAGFICLACFLGADPKGYTDPNHPAQTAVRAAIESAIGMQLGPDLTGVDGCSAPAYAVPLVNLAQGFARFVTGEGLPSARAAAARRLFDAVVAEPFMVAGTGRPETELMAAFGHRLFVKGGAEGAYVVAFPEKGLGVAVKFDDGAGRAAEVAIAAAIEAYLAPNDAERAVVERWMIQPVRRFVGPQVGEVRPVPGLVRALRDGTPLS